jgi:hypothetical protein
MAAKKNRDEKKAEPQADTQGAAPAVAAPTVGAAAGGLSTEAMTRLRELGELHESGVLTDEEFEGEKAKVLGS